MFIKLFLVIFMKIIGISGMPGSGKSGIFNIAEKYNIPIISMGDAIRYEVKKQGLELNSENIKNMAIGIREKYGKEAVAVICVDYINSKYKNNLPEYLIIEGIRSIYEVEYFRKYYSMEIISIHSSPKVRFKRLCERNREDDSVSWEHFKERDYRELGFSIGYVIALSDYIVINENNNWEEYLNNLEKIVLSIVKF